ncbi:hypothetical protein RHSIM_Rhsim06G0013900 [Rhododendron simsii]|uniref:Uncharacterized protein n=1 Tax=Rhododendron simsii TaxID=118357 RepID=A0A834LNW8_RHOSS|nr:hypothetical protein RHSIM_Rhsim06G0013900 [Rhododendron simsii]
MNHGIVFDDTWKEVDDLEILIKRLKAKKVKDGKMKGGIIVIMMFYSDPGWSRELGPSSEISEKRVVWEESGHDHAAFVKELGVLRTRADRARSREEAFEAKEEFVLALEAAEAGGNQWSYLLPQIHVNLGISLEGDGMGISDDVKAFQRITRLSRCDVELLKAMTENNALVSYSEILSVLDELESGRVDLGMFFAVLAPICGGTAERRKPVAFDALYGDLLHQIVKGHLHSLTCVMSSLVKLESVDRNRHGYHVCSVCRYPVIGSWFKEMKSHFSLCSQCYSEGKVPPTFKLEEYKFTCS